MKICKNCGEVNTNDSLYCCGCGSSSLVFGEEVVCSHCGATNVSSDVHCTSCGAPIPTVAEPVVNAPVQPVEAPKPPVVKVLDENSEHFKSVIPATETVLCPDCGSPVPITAIFCNHCGANVVKLHQHRVVTRAVCPHCGRPNSLEARYCSYCYSPLDEAETTDMQVTYETEPVGDMVVAQAYLQDHEGKSIVCPNCSTLNKPGEAFCVNCGLKLIIEDNKKYCPICGTENPADSSFCTKCQWSFTGLSPDAELKWKCIHCGNVNDREDTFCSQCGAAKKQTEVKQ